jgi:hypothetical protein
MDSDEIVKLFELLVYASEDEIGFAVATPTCLPAENDSLVVAEQSKVRGGVGINIVVQDCEEEEFDTNGFCPADVSLTVKSSPPGV